MRGIRPKRIADLVHRELAKVLRTEMKDPRVGLSVSPTSRSPATWASPVSMSHLWAALVTARRCSPDSSPRRPGCVGE